MDGRIFHILPTMTYTTGIMVISYYGGECFKVSFGSTTLAFNPIGKKSKLPPVKFGSDAAFITMWHDDFNGIENVKHGSKDPFLVDGPGEYEIGSVVARGFGVKTTYDQGERFNTIYQVKLEEMNMVFLGALSDSEIDSKILSELGDIDILFVPIGGGDVLEVPQASKLAVKLEAKLIIPMHYDDVALQAFLKEEGNDSVKPVEKLTIKRKDVNEMQGEVVVIKS
jgi:L-ascorbate metabolism protein UlaG (beta-lactamase superfamily)